MNFKTAVIFFLFPYFSIFSQEVACEQYYEKGYYPEAINCLESELKGCEKNDECNTTYLLLGKSNYALHRYKIARNYFSRIPVEKITDKETQIQFLQTLREEQNYTLLNQLITSFKLEDEYSENWAKEPSIAEENQFFNIVEVNCDFGESFLGATTSEGGIITSASKKDTPNKTAGYRLAFFKKETDTVLVAEKADYLSDDLSNESIFEGNPTNFGEDKIIFCKNTTNTKWYKDLPDRQAGKKKSKFNLSENGENLLHLYSLNKKDQTVQILPTLINKKGRNTVTPFYDEVHKLLFFSQSDEKGIYNIFYAKQNGASWSEPIAVSDISTSFDDVYPFVIGNEIYFSSRGRNGLGGLDVFVAQINFDGNKLNISDVKNLAQPVNSGADDFSFFFTDENSGYFASNRSNKSKNDALFYFKYTKQSSTTSQVIDPDGKPVAASVTVYEKLDNEEWKQKEVVQLEENGIFNYPAEIGKEYKFDVSADFLEPRTVFFNGKTNKMRETSQAAMRKVVLENRGVVGEIKSTITEKGIADAVVRIYQNGILIDSVTTNEEGEWKYRFNRNKNYDIEIEARNYDKQKFELSGKEKTRRAYLNEMKEVALSPEVKKDAVIRINNINFDFNSSTLQKKSFHILDNVVVFLNNSPTTRIELSAHTDCEGRDNYNLLLSERRAKSAVSYLVGKGIPKSRLVAVGYGETKIINSCTQPGQCSEKENEVNRRVEIKILN